MKSTGYICLGALLCASLVHAAPMACWNFDDGTGNTVSDISGNGHHGTGTELEWVQGAVNSAAQLDGQGGIDAGDGGSLDAGNAITLQAWICPWKPQSGNSPSIIGKEGAYVLGLSPGQSLALTLWLDGKKQVFESKRKGWEDGAWHHVAATYDGSAVCLYVDGGLDSTVPAKGRIAKSAAPCVLGGGFGGALDEICIDSAALDSRVIALACYEGNYQMARIDNRFTDFYEKIQKRGAEPRVPGALWIDAEDFDDYGGWWMDTQFVPQMGSPYLIAAGIGKPVGNAKTTVKIPDAGTYRLWVRNKNWLAEGQAPGRFAVSVNGVKSETVFGTREQRAWVWQDGGVFKLEKGAVQLELEDLTGYYGRCDALILTKDLGFDPKQEQKDYLPMRERFVGTVPMTEMGHFDFIVVGGGVAGCNAAIAAARGGAKVALIQNRPMVGGNNSSEMGVPVSGGSSSGRGRETGLNEEIGRIHAFNYLSKWASGAELAIANETNITLFLNTNVFEAETDADKRIVAVKAFDMVDGHHTRYTADLFADCTGDGWLGYYAGAEWMLGRESKETFGESNAKDVADQITMSGSLMQNTVLGFKAIDMGKPTPFDAPEWVYDLSNSAEGYPKRPNFEHGIHAGNWWTENHGRNDDLWDPEWARDDLILVSLSYYNWIKNFSGLAEKAKNFQLRFIPITNAKRETRRLVGDHILIEQDMVNRVVFPDRVGYFVWKLDIHHPLGIFSAESPYDFETNFSPASMPYRILYSKNIPNLFMAGRDVSVSHVALGTARVQGTTGMMGQVVGTAAAMCKRYGTTPRGIYEAHIPELQQKLLKDDVVILHLRNEDPGDLARTAKATASSTGGGRMFGEEQVKENGDMHYLNVERAMMFRRGASPHIGKLSLLLVSVGKKDVEVVVTVRGAKKMDDYSSTADLAVRTVNVPAGNADWIEVDIDCDVPSEYAWFSLSKADGVAWNLMDTGPDGAGSAFRDGQKGWRPNRNRFYAFHLDKPIVPPALCGPGNVINGLVRPLDENQEMWIGKVPDNMWISDPAQAMPQWVELDFGKEKKINAVYLTFDTNLGEKRYASEDFSGEGRMPPECVRDYQVQVLKGREWVAVADVKGNYQRRRIHRFDPVETSKIRVLVTATNGDKSARIYEIRAYHE